MKNKTPIILIFLFVILPAAMAGGLYIGSVIFATQLSLKTAPSVGMLPYYWMREAPLPASALMPMRLATGAALLFAVAAPAFMLALLFGGRKRELHGSMRFANTAEVRQSGLLKTDKKYAQGQPDLIVGKFNGRYLRWAGNEFMYLAARTRSGKGVGIVVPNCLHYRDSMVVYDPKLENYLLTAGFRARHGQQVFLFNPGGRMPEHETNPTLPLQSHRWNPFTYVRRNPHYTYKDLSAMAAIMLPVSPRDSGSNTFFTESGRKLFVGLGLYLIETEDERDLSDYHQRTTLSHLFRLTTPADGKPLTEWIKDELKLRGHTLSDQCRTLLGGFAGGNAKTSADILSTMTAPLGIFLDPVVEAATSDDDFSLYDLRRQRMTVYIGIIPTETAVFARLTNLLFSQIVDVTVQQGLPENNPALLKYQCLMLMDEFTALGNIPAIQHGVSYIAGYNLRLLIIIQSPSQVEAVYGRENMHTFFSNFTLRIFFTPREQNDAEEYSKVIGYETFKSKSVSRSRGKGGSSRSQNTGDQKRAVMNPDEIKRMPLDKCVIDMAGIMPVYADKIFYHSDAAFKDRVSLPRPELPVLHVRTRRSETPGGKVHQFVPTDRLPETRAQECVNSEELAAPTIANLAAIAGADPDGISEYFAAAQKAFGSFGVKRLSQLLDTHAA